MQPFYHAFTVSFVTTVVADTATRFSQHSTEFLGRVTATRTGVCAEVEDALQSNYRADTTERLNGLQDELRVTFTALPKTPQGNLDAPSTRYLLHRHFLRTRAWWIQGIAPEGFGWNNTSPLALLDTVNASVQELFEQRLRNRGLDLQDVATLAALIENQVHQDSVGKLMVAWKVLGMPTVGETIAREDVEHVLDAYMMEYVIHDDELMQNKDDVEYALTQVHRIYPKWNYTQQFVREMLRRVMREEGMQEFTFADVDDVAVLICERYGEFQFGECHDTKVDILEIEGHKAGRVPLKEFSRQNLENGKYHFGESADYMRKLGILDEANPDNPFIIVPNYNLSPSQFAATSDMYAVTCLDECEQILLDVEKAIAGPYATPQRLATVVAGLESENQPKRLNGLPERLMRRLEESARHGKGNSMVALHGRLFAQFLHHAFPRECSYPYVSNSGVEIMLPSVFKNVTGLSSFATKEEHQKNSALPGLREDERDTDKLDLDWDAREEVFTPYLEPRRAWLPKTLVPWLQVMLCLLLLGALVPHLEFLRFQKTKK